MKPGVGTRLAAVEHLRRILDEGAHSNVLLDQPGTVQGRDRAAVHRLTLDALRWQPRTDALVVAMSERDLDSLDPMVLHVLRVAMSELHLGGDAHGVVDSAVEVLRKVGSGRASGFVNALLRRTTRNDLPELTPGLAKALSVGVPEWMFDALAKTYGAEGATELLASLNEPAHIGVRLRDTSAVPGEGWATVDGIDGAYLIDTRAAVEAAGESIMVMDPASTAVANAVDAQPGMRVIDLAAAPGNKTAALWDAMGGQGVLVAADRNGRRAKRADRRAQKLGVGAHWVVADAQQPSFPQASFDRVLLDAPCTGLGTVRRRPEIKGKLQSTAPALLGEMQRQMLESALRLVAPGGHVVYSVCTFFAEETVDVVADLGGVPPDGTPGVALESGVVLSPEATGTDGMFVSIVRPH